MSQILDFFRLFRIFSAIDEKSFSLIYQELSEESDSWFPLFRTSVHTGICKKNPYRLFISQIYIIFPNKTMCKVLTIDKFYVLNSRLFQTFPDFLSNWWKNIFPDFQREIIKEESGSVFYWFSVFWTSLILKSNRNSLKEHISQIYHSSK